MLSPELNHGPKRSGDLSCAGKLQAAPAEAAGDQHLAMLAKQAWVRNRMDCLSYSKQHFCGVQDTVVGPTAHISVFCQTPQKTRLGHVAIVSQLSTSERETRTQLRGKGGEKMRVRED